MGNFQAERHGGTSVSGKTCWWISVENGIMIWIHEEQTDLV